ncbi:MAG TPA: CAP domain-containing protein [Bdellovibrionales bacterium]|nr:CAP domain-containing protein [Bdellovibrionales bacterium]
MTSLCQRLFFAALIYFAVSGFWAMPASANDFEMETFTEQSLAAQRTMLEQGDEMLEAYKSGRATCKERVIVPESDLTAEEREFLVLINNYRKKYRLQSLQVSRCLTVASRWMSQDMGKKNYFDHQDSHGRDPSERVQIFGVKTFSGENIGAGYRDAKAMFQGWKTSPGHNRNMLSKTHKYIGIGHMIVPNSVYKDYWTTDFGY